MTEQGSEEKKVGRRKWRDCCSWPCTRAFLLKNFLPLGFTCSIIWMLAWPWPGEKIDQWRVKGFGVVETVCIIIIFLISGLVLKTQEILFAIKHPWPLIYGIVAILGVTPCLGFATIRLPLSPPEFAIGLSVFAIGPSTLAQGQTLVAQAGGNTALALMLLVVTNILAVFTAPFLVRAILASRVDAGNLSLQPAHLLITLVVTILTPALVGKAIRDAVPPLARWVSGHRVTMSLLNNGSLLVIVWIQLCAAHNKLSQQPFQDIVLIIVSAVLLHFVFVAINWPMVLLFRFPPREAIAALIMSSQKTMPFAVSMIALLPASLGSKGLLTLPPLVAQVSQLFCDVWISAHFGRKIEAESRAFAAAEETLPTVAKSGGGGDDASTGDDGGAQKGGELDGAAAGAQEAPEPGGKRSCRPPLLRRQSSLAQGVVARASSLRRASSTLSAPRPDVLRQLSSGGGSRGSTHDAAAAYCADAGSIEEPPSEVERASSLASSSNAGSPRSQPQRSRRAISITLG